MAEKDFNNEHEHHDDEQASSLFKRILFTRDTPNRKGKFVIGLAIVGVLVIGFLTSQSPATQHDANKTTVGHANSAMNDPATQRASDDARTAIDRELEQVNEVKKRLAELQQVQQDQENANRDMDRQRAEAINGARAAASTQRSSANYSSRSGSSEYPQRDAGESGSSTVRRRLIIYNEFDKKEEAPVRDPVGDALGGPPQPPPPVPSVETPKRAVDDKKKRNKLDFDSSWTTYILPGGSTEIECVLENKLEGTYTGPVKCMSTTDAFAPGTHLLIFPKGTEFLGSAQPIANTDQKRIAVAFKRALVHRAPGYGVYTVPLEDDSPGLDQQGAMGLKDKVRTHAASTFGASLAIAAIGGVSNIGNTASALNYDPSTQFRQGIATGSAQSASRTLDRYSNRLPEVEIRPGTRTRIILIGDVEAPEYHPN